MTIVIGVAVPEGLILAGDSRATFRNAQGWPKISSDYTEKVYRVTDKVGAATYGWGFLNQKNINSLIEEYKDNIESSANIEEVLPSFVDFFEKQYEKHIQSGFDTPVENGNTAFGFIVGGYNEHKIGKLHLCLFPGKRVYDGPSTSVPGANWQGQTDIITRLIKGYDPRLNISALPQDIQHTLSGGEYLVYFNQMNLQDAIDFSIFLVRTTVEMQRFSDGVFAVPGDVAGVGGFIDVLMITKKNIQWIQKKELRGEVPSWMHSVR